MPDRPIRFPVVTHDGRELLSGGEILSDDLLRGISGTSGEAPHPETPFLEYGSVRTDLLAYMNWHVYRQVFGDADEAAPVLRAMETIRLPSPVFDILRYFQENDPYTYRHILIVSALTCLFARNIEGNSRNALPGLTAAPLHDLGKVSVPLEIMRKTKPLRRTERAYLEHHTTAGFVILVHYTGGWKNFSCVVARDHHERKDGSGYPRGILLDDRLVEIVVACDVYDALISPRPYRRRSFDNRTAIEEITAMAEEGRIGWDVVRFLVSRNRTGRPPAEECTVSEEKRGTPPDGNLYGIVLEDDHPAEAGSPPDPEVPA